MTKLSLIVFLSSLSLATHAMADAAKAVDVPAGELVPALEALEKQAEVELVFQSAQLKGYRTQGVKGTYEAKEAIRLLLRGTGLELREDRSGAMLIAPPRAKTRAEPRASSEGAGTNEGEHLHLAQAPAGNASAEATTQTQSAAVEEASNGVQLQEITVTARKTTERLQDVPMSVAVVNSQLIEKTGAISLSDLGREVAGLTVVSAAPGQNVITLRGLSGNNTVGLYLDDTPLTVGIGNAVQPTNFDMDAALFDLSRVEVLRGPQGSLYGASSFGGTIRYITNQPDFVQTQATVKTTLSGTDGGGFNQEVDGLVNLPLVPGTVALRAMAFERDYDGYIDRYPTDPNNYLAVLSGPVAHNVNTEKTFGGRVALEAKPTDSFSATLSAYYQKMDLGAPFTFDAPPGSFDNPIQSRLVSEPSTDRFSLYNLTLQQDIQAVHVISSTSYADRLVYNTEDDSKDLYYFFPQVGRYIHHGCTARRATTTSSKRSVPRVPRVPCMRWWACFTHMPCHLVN